MAVTLRPTFEAPAGWTNIITIPAYAGASGVAITIVSKNGNGAVCWGGASAPVDGIPVNIESGVSGTGTAVWLRGPASYVINVND